MSALAKAGKARREGIIDRYRRTYVRANGGEAPEVTFRRGGWYVIHGRFETKVREREIFEMIAALKARAEKKEKGE